MGVNLYTFVGVQWTPTMAQMGTHNGFWAPTKNIKATTTVSFFGAIKTNHAKNCLGT